MRSFDLDLPRYQIACSSDIKPADAVTPELIKVIRIRKFDLLALLRKQAEIDRSARLDAERREADRQAKRGYDFDRAPQAISNAKRLKSTG